MLKKYKERDGKLIVTNEVEEEMNLDKLIQLRDHYKKDIIHFTSKLEETEKMINEAKKLGIKTSEERNR